MARYTHYYSSFLGGELDPKTLGRTDTPLYKASAERIRNFIVQPQGGITRRPGFKYIRNAATTSDVRLIPFTHTSGAKYMLEFSNLKFRVFKNGAVIGAPLEITTVFTTAMIPDIDFDQSGDIMYLTHESVPPQKLTRASDTSWTIGNLDFKCAPMYPLNDAKYGRTEDIGNTAITATSISGNNIGSIRTFTMSGSIFSADDVGKFIRIKNFTADPDSEANATITTVQTAQDVIVQNGGGTTGYDSLSYTSAGVVNGRDLIKNKVDTLQVLKPLVTTSTRTTPYSTVISTISRVHTGSSASTITSSTNSTASIVSSGDVVTSETVTVTGNETETWGLLEITAYISTSSVSVKIIRPLSSRNFHSSQMWQMSRFGANTGYPKKVSFHEGRALFANHGSSPNVLLGSKTGNIDDFENGEGDEGTLTASTSFDFTLSEIRAIQWLNPSQKMIVGATNGVYALSGSSLLGINPLSPPIFRKVSNSQCSEVKPIFTQNTTFFTHSNSEKVASLTFKPGEFSGFEYKELTLMSGHLSGSGIKEWAIYKDVIWMVNVDTTLSGFTFNEELNINPWHSHTSTGGLKSIASLDNDYMYAATNRTINSLNVQYIEYMAEINQNTPKEDFIHVDSAFTYDSTATSTITGLSHLEGETVDILLDGASHPQQTVVGGQVSLTQPASVVQLGIPFESEIITSEVSEGNRRGSRESRKSSIQEVGIKFLNTNGANISSGKSPNTEIAFNENQIYGKGANLFTGTKVRRIRSGTTLNPKVSVKSEAALPITILGITADINVSET